MHSVNCSVHDEMSRADVFQPSRFSVCNTEKLGVCLGVFVQKINVGNTLPREIIVG